MIWVSHNRSTLHSTDYYFSNGNWIFRIAFKVLYANSPKPEVRPDFEGGPVASKLELRELIRAIFLIGVDKFTDA